jgi:hypothetical protein
MNSYNYNLRNAIVTSLQNQEMDMTTGNGALNAAMFDLYYAEGATITAYEKLQSDVLEETARNLVNKQAVNNNNIAFNMQASVTQANSYLQQSITNTSVCAANVQVASNAIVGLAGDVGNIFSILNAGDYETDMYELAKEIRDHINDTAYAAEVASKMSMEASILTSEVSGTVVLNKAKGVMAAVSNLLGITTADFNTISQSVDADYANLATTDVLEKQAEGNMLDINIEANATDEAYKTSNKVLNHNLRISKVSKTGFNVRFDLIKAPFARTPDKNNEALQLILPPDTIHIQVYPVKEYYALVVKNTKKYTFSMSDAQSVAGKTKQRLSTQLEITSKPILSSEKPGEVSLHHFISQRIDLVKDGVKLKDSDGDDVSLGVDYSVFVYAVYQDDYKRKINNFEDFLSAPSEMFVATSKLRPVKASSIEVKPLTDEARKTIGNITGDVTEKGDTYLLNFKTIDHPATGKAEYRLMFLPYRKDLTAGMLTLQSLGQLQADLELLQRVAEKFDPEIERLNSQLASLSIELARINLNIDKHDKTIKTAEKEIKELEKQRESTNPKDKAVIQALDEKIAGLTSKLKDEKQKEAAEIKAWKELLQQITLINTEMEVMQKAKEDSLKGARAERLVKGDELVAAVLNDVLEWENLPKDAPEKTKQELQKKIVKAAEELAGFINDFLKRTAEIIRKDPDGSVARLVKDIEANLLKILGYGASHLTANHSAKEKAASQNEVKAALEQIKKDLEKLYNQVQLISPETGKIGFIFNVALAQQVPYGNWTQTYLQNEETVTDPDGTFYVNQTWVTTFGDETTDNFGNRLVNGNEYIPVLLSTSDPETEATHKVSDALSDFQHTTLFKYQEKK